MAALSGSLRAASVNTALLGEIAARAHHAVAALREILRTMAARIVDDVPLITAIAQIRLEGMSHAA